MNLELRMLDRNTLLKQTHETVRQEKLCTTLLLQHLLEIEKRSLHLEQGHFNLHSFLVFEFKYSDSEAATRLQAMKLLKAHPEVKEKMEKGTISLSQAADISRFIKAEMCLNTLASVQVENPIPFSNVSTAAFSKMQECAIFIDKIIKEVEGKSMRESKELLEKMRSSPRAKVYTIEIDEEAWKILQEIKKNELSSARDGDFTKKIFRERLRRNLLKVKKNDVKKKSSINTKNKDKDNEKVFFIDKERKTVDEKYSVSKESKDVERKTPLSTEKNDEDEIRKNGRVVSRYIGKKISSQLFQEAGFQCEYISLSTGRRCECKSDLQVDHLYPYAWGGSHGIGNTRILCVQHNAFYGELVFGKEKMEGFRRT